MKGTLKGGVSKILEINFTIYFIQLSGAFLELICSPYSRHVLKSALICLLGGDIFYGEKSETYDISFKKKAVDLYHQKKNFAAVSRELNTHRKNIQRWVKQFSEDGMVGLRKNVAEKVNLVQFLHLPLKIPNRK